MTEGAAPSPRTSLWVVYNLATCSSFPEGTSSASAGGIGVISELSMAASSSESIDADGIPSPHQRGFIVAGNWLQAGDAMENISPNNLSFRFHQEPETASETDAIEMNSFKGKLKPKFSLWTKFLKLAPDCQAANVLLSLDLTNREVRQPGSLRMIVIQPIPKGKALLAWFSEDLIQILRIPHLSLKNFLGSEGRYVCDRCALVFCDPNPLKVHLALDCGKETTQELLKRIRGNQTQSNLGASAIYTTPPATPVAASLDFSRKANGHLCIYCGKWYSRKYGLKIHIRTHTGFKPLQCKICLRAFGDPSNLNKHIRLHSQGESPYKCHHCGKILVRRRDLQRHLTSRHATQTLRQLPETRTSEGRIRSLTSTAVSSERAASTPSDTSSAPELNRLTPSPPQLPPPPILHRPKIFPVFPDPRSHTSSAFHPILPRVLDFTNLLHPPFPIVCSSITRPSFDNQSLQSPSIFKPIFLPHHLFPHFLPGSAPPLWSRSSTR